jgi:hypothetical protein
MSLYHSLNQKAMVTSAPELFFFGACAACTALAACAACGAIVAQ